MTDVQVCRRCGAENLPGISYCATCGQRLVAADEATAARPSAGGESLPCPRCGASNRTGAAFCSECGFNIRPAVAAAGAPPVQAAVAEDAVPAAAPRAARAWLGPLVLLIGAAGMATAWFLPFAVGPGSLAEQALGQDGFGIAFWTAYPEDAGVLEAAYFGLAAPLPILVLLMLVLAVVGGTVRAVPGRPQRVGLGVVFLWCVAFAALFVVVEIAAALGADLIGLLRSLSPGGLIGFLSGVIGAIGAVTRLAGG